MKATSRALAGAFAVAGGLASAAGGQESAGVARVRGELETYMQGIMNGIRK